METQEWTCCGSMCVLPIPSAVGFCGLLRNSEAKFRRVLCLAPQCLAFQSCPKQSFLVTKESFDVVFFFCEGFHSISRPVCVHTQVHQLLCCVNVGRTLPVHAESPVRERNGAV